MHSKQTIKSSKNGNSYNVHVHEQNISTVMYFDKSIKGETS